MDEIWEKAVETALDGQTDHGAVATLTLDGAVKCVQGRLPPPGLLQKFENLQHLSLANIGVSSLEQFPQLKKLEKLILSDNRIAGGLEFLVEAGLDSLRDLDLSNNRIQYIEDLAPLAELRLVSLDLYECPVTRVKDYRSRVFGMIKSLKYLDKMDDEENERPESEDEEEDDEDDEEDDPGSGEVDGEERPLRRDNGHSDNMNMEGIVDAEEEEESDADEEETETARRANGMIQQVNGFHFEEMNGDYGDDDEEGEDYEENDSGEEIDEEDDGAEVHGMGESEDEDDDDDEEDEDDEDEEEEVDNDEGNGDFLEPGSTGRLTSTEGEIDGHEQGEEDGDDDGETGEEEQVVEDDGEFEGEDEDEAEEEDEDFGAGYLVQPVGQADEHEDAGGSYMDPGNDEVEEEEDVEDDDEVQDLPPSSSSQLKRKRGDDADEDDNGEDDEEDDDAEYTKSSSKKHH